MKKILRLVQSFRKLYWKISRPTTRGIRAIVVDSKEKVLLVEHQYLDGWYLPGGKCRSGEEQLATLHRELQEELGIQEISDPVLLGEYVNNFEYKKDHISVFIIKNFKQKPKKHFEIKTYQYFDPEQLPEKTSPGTRKRIEEWLGKRKSTSQW